MKKSTLKELKKELEEKDIDNNTENLLTLCDKILKLYPKNSYGYIKKIELKTSNYKKYLSEEELKDLKKTYDKCLDIISKKEKDELKKKFSRYIDDCLEVENYKKLKIKIITKKLIKEILSRKYILIDNEISLMDNINIKRHKIGSLIHGLFLIFCLIYNVLSPNYLLFLTIPFGVFGIISIYTYVVNIINKNKLKIKIKNMNILTEEKNKLEEEIPKYTSAITFNTEKLNETLNKIPNCFNSYVTSLFEDDDKIINNIINSIKENDMVTLNYLVNKYTEFKDDEISYYSAIIKDQDDELINYINKNKVSSNDSINYKKIQLYNYVLQIIFLIISVFSYIILYNNFYEINNNAFLISIIVGIFSIFVYDTSYKKVSLTDAVNDNLLSTIFNTTLLYDLIYFKTTSELNISYGFIQMPIIFLLIYLGPLYLITLIKYKIMQKK